MNVILPAKKDTFWTPIDLFHQLKGSQHSDSMYFLPDPCGASILAPGCQGNMKLEYKPAVNLGVPEH